MHILLGKSALIRVTVLGRGRPECHVGAAQCIMKFSKMLLCAMLFLGLWILCEIGVPSCDSFLLELSINRTQLAWGLGTQVLNGIPFFTRSLITLLVTFSLNQQAF